MKNRPEEKSPLFYARVAGFAYLLIIIIGLLNANFIDSKLIVSGNDAVTAHNIMANDLLFRIGTAGTLILYASVLFLSWALYIILKPVNKNLALLAFLLRLAEAILGGATVLISFIVLHLLNGSGYSTVFGTEPLQVLVRLFLNVRTSGLDIVLLFVGFGGTIFCYLFLKSRYVPRILATWGILTYLSMVLLSLVSILFPNHPMIIEIVLYSQGGLFELVFGFWLLLKGINVQQGDTNTPASQAKLQG